MKSPALIERITRSLAFMLRHQPDRFDLELDPFGYADLGETVRALNERLGEPVVEDDVVEAVESGDRVRYEIQGDKIRALYGHSIPVEPGPAGKPPELLYVAIPASEVDRARRFGLRGGRRRFLHLALTLGDARDAGRRAAREYSVLEIRALDAWEEGVNFYDRRSLWLAEELPTHLLEVEGSYDDGRDPVPRGERGPRQDGGRGRDRDRGRGRRRPGDDDGPRGGRGRSRRGGRGRDRDRDREREPREASAADERPPREEREPRTDREPRQDREPRRERSPSRDEEPRRERERAPRRESAGRESDSRRTSADTIPRPAPPEREPARAREKKEDTRRSSAPATPFGAGVVEAPAPARRPAPEPAPKREEPEERAREERAPEESRDAGRSGGGGFGAGIEPAP